MVSVKAESPVQVDHKGLLFPQAERQVGIFMIDFQGEQIYQACGATDMRETINGLSTIARLALDFKNAEGCLFVFCNRNRNRMKVLEWDEDSFWLYAKRLEGGNFPWPSSNETAR